MKSFWEEARKNRLKSYAILASIFLIYGLLVAVIWEISPAFGLIVLFIVFLYLASILLQPLSMTAYFLGAKEVKGDEEKLKLKQLYNVVDEIRIAANYPKMPRIYLIDTDYPNAFAVSLGDRVAIGVTRGLLNMMNREELTGVIAHEFSHIINRDSDVKLIAFLAVAAISITAEILLRTRWRGSGKKGSGGLILLAILLAVIGVVLSRIAFFALSRERETLADVEAVRLTRNKYGLISALKKIGGYKGEMNIPSSASFLFFANPLKKDFFAKMFSTHPPIEERIKLLEEL